MLVVRQRCALDERLQWRFAVAILSRVRSFGVVPLHPYVNVGMKFSQRVVLLTAKRARVELVLDGLMESFANPVRLRTPRLRPRMLDVLQVEVQRILVRFPVAAVLAPAIGQNPKQRTPCSSKKVARDR